MQQNALPNFLALPPERSAWESSRVAIIPAPLEKTTSFQHGTALGPQALLNASRHLESFDLEAGTDFTDIGITTLAPLNFAQLLSQQALDLLRATVDRVLDANLWPLTIGGEHAVCLGPILALKARHPELSVLQIGAHAELRDTFEGSKFSQACVMRRVLEAGVHYVNVGLRSHSKEEGLLLEKEKIPVFHDHVIQERGLRPAEVSACLSKTVYISINMDGFSPAECPGSGKPQPGGLGWYPCLALMRHLFKNHNVVGLDISELRPLADSAQSEVFAAKLAYKMIGMKFFKQE